MIVTGESISYLTEADEEYAKALKVVERDPIALADLLADWRYLVADAQKAARGMADRTTWERWLSELKPARRLNGRVTEAWMLEFGAILMPEILVRVTEVKVRFKTSWGLAFHRMMDTGFLTEQAGVVVWVGPPPMSEAQTRHQKRGGH